MTSLRRAGRCTSDVITIQRTARSGHGSNGREGQRESPGRFGESRSSNTLGSGGALGRCGRGAAWQGGRWFPGWEGATFIHPLLCCRGSRWGHRGSLSHRFCDVVSTVPIFCFLSCLRVSCTNLLSLSPLPLDLPAIKICTWSRDTCRPLYVCKCRKGQCQENGQALRGYSEQ